MLLPRGKFALIMADPPWKSIAWSDKGLKQKSAESHYQTMTMADIKAIDLASIALDDAVLWLWTTWSVLLGEDQNGKTGLNPGRSQPGEVMAAWGFRYSTGGAWHKRTVHGKTAFGTGKRLRGACEPFLIGVRGKPKTTKVVRNLVEDLVREHSRKPEAAYHACERLMPNVARLSLFCRYDRPGWLSWGDEAGKFNAPAAPPAPARVANQVAREATAQGASRWPVPSNSPRRSRRNRAGQPSSPSGSP